MAFSGEMEKGCMLTGMHMRKYLGKFLLAFLCAISVIIRLVVTFSPPCPKRARMGLPKNHFLDFLVVPLRDFDTCLD